MGSRVSICIRATILLLAILFVHRTRADDPWQRDLSVQPEVIRDAKDRLWIKVSISTELRLRRVGVRATRDGWRAKADYEMAELSPGKYSAIVGPLERGESVELAVFGEDPIADGFVWDNHFSKNHRISVPKHLSSIPKTDRLFTASPLSSKPIDLTKGAGNVLLDPIVKEALEKHRVYLSLTTSPQRISNVVNVIESLDLSLVEKIFVSIPKKFGRDGLAYEIPAILINHPKVRILQIENDLGPITKLIPPTTYLRRYDPTAWLVTVDDDIAYPKTAIRELAAAKAYHHDAVISASGQSSAYWKISHADFPGSSKNDNYPIRSSAVQPVDVVEGFAATIYAVKDLDPDMLQTISSLSKETFVSDDLVVSYYLGQQDIPRLRLESRHFNVTQIHETEVGMQDDALHRGAGLMDARSHQNINETKYQKAFQTLHADFPDSLSWKVFRCNFNLRGTPGF